MPNIPAVLEKADFDALAEAKIADFFTEREGKYYPNFSQGDIEKLAVGLRANKDAILKEKNDIEKRLKAYQEKYGTEEELDARLAEFETRLSEAGTKTEKELADRHRQELENLKATHKAAMEKLMQQGSAREQELLGHVSQTKLQAEIAQAIAKHGGKDKFLQPHLERLARVAEVKEGDATQFVTQVLDANGQPRVADHLGTPMSIENLVGELRNDPEWADAFYAPNKGGGGAPARQFEGQNFGGALIVDREASKNNPRLYQEAKQRAAETGQQVRFSE